MGVGFPAGGVLTGREPTPHDACRLCGQEIGHCFLPVVLDGLHDSVLDLVGPGLAAGPPDVASDVAVEVDQAVAGRLVVQGQPVARTDFLADLSAEQLPVEPGRRGPVEVNAEGPLRVVDVGRADAVPERDRLAVADG